MSTTDQPVRPAGVTLWADYKRWYKRRSGPVRVGITVAVVAVVMILGIVAISRGGVPNTVTDNDLTLIEDAAAVGDSVYIEAADDGQTLIIDGRGDVSSGASTEDIAVSLMLLGMPQSVVARMDNTRALDGTQSASWNGFTATWTYHPDSGLDIVVTDL